MTPLLNSLNSLEQNRLHGRNNSLATCIKDYTYNVAQVTNTVLFKAGKDPNLAKSYRPTNLFCLNFKLLKLAYLNRINLFDGQQLIKQQAGARSGMSTPGQLFNRTRCIEGGFNMKNIPGTVFVDLSAASDTINNCDLLKKNL